VYESIAPSKDDIMLLGPLQTLASVYFQTGQHQKAIALYNRAIAISQSATNTTPMMRVATMWGIASTYYYGGRKDLAQPLIKRTIGVAEAEIAKLEKANPDDYQIQSLVGQLGYMYRYAGDLASAEKAFVKTIEIARKKNQFSGWESVLADLKRAQGKPKEALALLERAKAESAKLSPESATAYNVILADVLLELGDYKRAERLLDEHRAFVVKNYGKRHPAYG